VPDPLHYSSPSPVAIVTAGAGLGIGHGLTEALCAAGWAVVIVDRDRDLAEALTKRIRENDGTIESLVLDVTAPGAAEQVVEATLKRFGRLDGLVNNVGVGLTKMVHEVSDEEFLELFNVDFMVSFRFARAGLPALRQSGGSIVNIGSVHARLNAPKYALYAATKAALEAFTRGLAVDYGPDGVRANIVHPGLVESPQNEALLANLFDNARAWMDDFAKKHQCIPRLALPREVGELVTFLLGEKARLITGQSIFIDGGTTTLLWDNQ
jgi:NAD(P)-dependent dehydrogenase (short-subunit alcohol dehydrogenase family)